MDTGIKISIIVPIYNAEKYLKGTLKSLTEQTLKEIEIICVNDGSTDNSGSILEECAKKDSRIKIITQQNRGQSAARNAGIKTAKGEFIGFLDADDFVDASAFEKLYNKSKDCDIVIGDICVYNQTNNTYDYNDSYHSINVFPKSFRNRTFSPSECKDFLFRIAVNPWNKIYRHSLLNENNILFCENINFEDNLFFLEMFLSAPKVSLAPDAVFFYRIDSETSYSHSNGKNDYKKLDFFKIVDIEENILKNLGVYNDLKDAFNLRKKQVLFYWLKKIKNPYVYIKYRLKLLKVFPVYMLFGKYFQRFLFKVRLKKLLKQKNTYIWVESGHYSFCSYVLGKSKIKNPLFVTNAENINGAPEIKNIKDVTPQRVIAITSVFYNYDKLVKQKLEEAGCKTEVCGLIFPI